MENKEHTESYTEHTESRYRDISRDVWIVFKKYLPDNVNLYSFPDDISLLTEKYKGKPGYRFMQRLLQVYFDELRDFKG